MLKKKAYKKKSELFVPYVALLLGMVASKMAHKALQPRQNPG